MTRTVLTCLLLSLTAGVANAATIRFDTDPFAGSTALVVPGRQIVGAEPSVNFDPATDVFSFAEEIFDIHAPLTFYNGLAADAPEDGAQVLVLQDAPIPFAAGLAADAIAARVTTPGAGFFIYFNSGLDLPRLVYSTDLSDPTADLKIMARMVNLTGPTGFASLSAFTADNFSTHSVPEPSSLTLMTLAAFAIARRARLRVVPVRSGTRR